MEENKEIKKHTIDPIKLKRFKESYCHKKPTIMLKNKIKNENNTKEI